MNRPTKIEYQHLYTTRTMVNSKGDTITVKEPRVTVCYLRMPADDDILLEPWTAVGIAICSQHDHPCKRQGRAIAYQRALFIVETMTSNGPVPHWHMLPIAPGEDGYWTCRAVHLDQRITHKAYSTVQGDYHLAPRKRS